MKFITYISKIKDYFFAFYITLPPTEYKA